MGRFSNKLMEQSNGGKEDPVPVSEAAKALTARKEDGLKEKRANEAAQLVIGELIGIEAVGQVDRLNRSMGG